MSNLKWEQSETDEEDIENYGEGVERWELIDYSTGSIVSIFFGRQRFDDYIDSKPVRHVR